MPSVNFRMSDEERELLARAAVANDRSIQREIHHRVFGAAPRGDVFVPQDRVFRGPDPKPSARR